MVINTRTFICVCFGYAEDGASGNSEMNGSIFRINLILIF
jgi:hypothetical protein